MKCRRRTCPANLPLWARDWYFVLKGALGRAPGLMVTVTAPGAGVLVWDRARCSHSAATVCAGTRACRVEKRVARAWNSDAAACWRGLTKAARERCRRHGLQLPAMAGRVWEMQARGVFHLHLAYLAVGAEDRVRVQEWATVLHELAPRFGFGFVDKRPREGRPGSYLAGYIGRGAKAHSFLEVVRSETPPVRICWVSPSLTARSGVTMRSQREQRILWAGWHGYIPHLLGLSDGRVVDIRTGMVRGMFADRGPPWDKETA